MNALTEVKKTISMITAELTAQAMDWGREPNMERIDEMAKHIAAYVLINKWGYGYEEAMKVAGANENWMFNKTLKIKLTPNMAVGAYKEEFPYRESHLCDILNGRTHYA